MKILVSISYYVPHISGLTNSIKNLSELLSKNGYRITVLTTQHSKKLKKREIIDGVEVIRVPYLFKFHKGFFMPAFPLAVWQAVMRSNQVIINLPQAEGFIVAVLAKFMGKKVHCIYHCDINIKEIFGAEFIEFLLRVTNFVSLLFVDTIITSSEDFAQHSNLLTRYANKIKTVNLVISSPVINIAAKNELAKRLQPKKRYLIGFIGRIATEKGVEYLLSAIPALKSIIGNDFTILIAGPKNVVGEYQYLEKVTKLFEKYKANIIMLGELKQSELGAFYSLLDVLVLPSVNNTEAFGMVQVEAMLCGTPVVATDLPGIRVPVLTTGMGELAEPENPLFLAEKIMKVLQNRNKYIKNKKEIEEHFGKIKILSQYQKIFVD